MRKNDDLLSEILDLQSKLLATRRQIEMFGNEIKRLRNLYVHNQENTVPALISHSAREGTDDLKNNLLGRLTTILITKQYFRSNKDLVDFAKKQLDITIPYWEKKSRPEIIGITIEKVFSLQPSKIRRFYLSATAFKKKEKESKIDNFYEEWEKIISELKFRE